eukprot:CAMPEP_0197657552 /NCGR_PEP_ID=MMETSP1338-20131121/44698_1 /TAXON_ID=43686 ORGANISM="Pelagodinium beii, Strain RCC1491" /NCGR_SAMPLE_ID=MMETSP1338 /ASSEMBLY_ACC=CAM_ASM_000754 /LENGTH=359 /DNA_ID=CAMNT_0043233949 /DNA_START=98 /DNA_END=1173 /DNA_ORIENTATION=+
MWHRAILVPCLGLAVALDLRSPKEDFDFQASLDEALREQSPKRQALLAQSSRQAPALRPATSPVERVESDASSAAEISQEAENELSLEEGLDVFPAEDMRSIERLISQERSAREAPAHQGSALDELATATAVLQSSTALTAPAPAPAPGPASPAPGPAPVLGAPVPAPAPGPAKSPVSAPGPAPGPAPSGGWPAGKPIKLVSEKLCLQLSDATKALSCSVVTQISGEPEGCECRLQGNSCPAADLEMGFTGVSPSAVIPVIKTPGETVILCMYWQWIDQPDRSKELAADKQVTKRLAEQILRESYNNVAAAVQPVTEIMAAATTLAPPKIPVGQIREFLKEKLLSTPAPSGAPAAAPSA